MCVTETFDLSMNTSNTNTDALTTAEAQEDAPIAFTPACRSKSLYAAPPRFDAEGWIFIALLTIFTASLAVMILAR